MTQNKFIEIKHVNNHKKLIIFRFNNLYSHKHHLIELLYNIIEHIYIYLNYNNNIIK
jgi:hypothetical protein